MKKIIFLLLSTAVVFAQSRPQKPTEIKPIEADTSKTKLVTLPTIMVFPTFKEGQNLRTVVEKDSINRVVMARVKEAFDRRGYSTVDFLSKVRNLTTNEILTLDTKTDLKTQIIGGSSADISVEVEYIFTESGSGNEVSVILNAYESSTSMTLSNKVGNSGKFYTRDVGRLINRAVEIVIDDFLNVMQQKFSDIVKNGRYLSLEFALGEGVEYNMTTEVGVETLPLSDVIEEWVTKNTKSYHIQGVTSLKTIFDIIRVPRTDVQGRNLTTTRYALELMRYLNQISITNKPERKIKAERLIKGNSIFITLK